MITMTNVHLSPGTGAANPRAGGPPEGVRDGKRRVGTVERRHAGGSPTQKPRGKQQRVSQRFSFFFQSPTYIEILSQA